MNRYLPPIIRLAIGSLLVLFVFSSLHASGQTDSSPPNIIFIICDQMRADAMGVVGNTNARTPNLDNLAEEGVMFRNHYVNNPVCLPSRISIFSGLFPHQTGVLCNKTKGEKLSFENTLSYYFKQNGYQIAWVGKNHTYDNKAFGSFDYSSIRAREEFRAYSKYVPPFWHSDTYWPEEDCNPRKNTEEAIQFIKQASGSEPFFLHISYFDPHPPYMAPAEFTQHYSSENIELPEYIDPEKLGVRLSEQQKALHYDKISDAELKETMRYYHASVEWGVDYQVGRIIETIEELGIEDNTVLVFTSDHGDFMGEYRMVRKGLFMYDALLNVPLIYYAPGRIKKGLESEYLSQGVDIFPTLLDFAGIKIPRGLEGHSLRKLMQGEVMSGDERLIVASAAYSDLPPGYWNNPEPYFDPNNDTPFHTRIENLTWQEEHKTMMVRNRDWKLIISDTREPELYFMDGGHVERENLYGKPEYEQKYRELLKEMPVNK